MKKKHKTDPYLDGILAKVEPSREQADLDKQYGDSLDITPEAIEEEYVRCVPHLARQNELYAEAVRRFLHAERAVKKLAAHLYLQFREEATKRISEHTLKAMVETDESYQDAKIEAIEAEAAKVKLYGRVEAMRAKKEAIISIGAQLRAEMGGSPQAASEARGRRDVERTRSRD